jgi:hypothetical protein
LGKSSNAFFESIIGKLYRLKNGKCSCIIDEKGSYKLIFIEFNLLLFIK